MVDDPKYRLRNEQRLHADDPSLWATTWNESFDGEKGKACGEREIRVLISIACRPIWNWRYSLVVIGQISLSIYPLSRNPSSSTLFLDFEFKMWLGFVYVKGAMEKRTARCFARFYYIKYKKGQLSQMIPRYSFFTKRTPKKMTKDIFLERGNKSLFYIYK